MFLRLSILAMAILVVQGSLAQDMDDFNRELANMNKECQIKSAAMKLIYACSKIQSDNSNPRFIGEFKAGSKGSPSASSSGANHCYNSLVNVERNGDQVRISILKDSGQNPEKSLYVTNASKLKASAEVADGVDGFVIPLSGLQSGCYFGSATNQSCSSLDNIPMGLVLDEKDEKKFSVNTNKRELTSNFAKANGSVTPALNQSTETKRTRALLPTPENKFSRLLKITTPVLPI